MIQLHVTPSFLEMALDQLGHAARKSAQLDPEATGNICFSVKYLLTAFVNMEARQMLADVARKAGFTVTGDNYREVLQVNWGVPAPKKEGWEKFNA